MKQLDSEIAQTMNSLDGIRQVESNPFLITRIEPKLAQKSQPIAIFSCRPVVKMAVIAALVVVNLMTLTNVFTKQNKQKSPQTIGFFSEQVSDYRY